MPPRGGVSVPKGGGVSPPPLPSGFGAGSRFATPSPSGFGAGSRSQRGSRFATPFATTASRILCRYAQFDRSRRHHSKGAALAGPLIAQNRAGSGRGTITASVPWTGRSLAGSRSRTRLSVTAPLLLFIAWSRSGKGRRVARLARVETAGFPAVARHGLQGQSRGSCFGPRPRPSGLLRATGASCIGGYRQGGLQPPVACYWPYSG